MSQDPDSAPEKIDFFRRPPEPEEVDERIDNLGSLDSG
jgi:hypothetical protein